MSELKDRDIEELIRSSLDTAFDAEGISVNDDLMNRALRMIADSADTDAAKWTISESEDEIDDAAIAAFESEMQSLTGDLAAAAAEFSDGSEMTAEDPKKVTSIGEAKTSTDRRKIFTGEESDDIRDRSAAKAVALSSRSIGRRRSWSTRQLIRLAGSLAAALAVVIIGGVLLKNMRVGHTKDSMLMNDMAAPEMATSKIVDVRSKTGANMTETDQADGKYFMKADEDEEESTSYSVSSADIAVVNVPNPMTESSAAEIYNQLGFKVVVPEDATDVYYYIIGDRTAHIEFTYNGADYTTRAVFADDLIDISGMYYDWSPAETVEWEEEAELIRVCLTAERDAGICLMYDREAHVMFTISIEGPCSAGALRELAEEIHVRVD